MGAFDLADLVDKLRTGYPTMSAGALIAIGMGIGWALAWLILRERISVIKERLELAAVKVASETKAKDEVHTQFQLYKDEVQTQFQAYKEEAANARKLAVLEAKVDAGFEKLAAANKEVRSAVGIAVGISSAVAVARAAGEDR